MSLRVLVVDDDQDARELLNELLEMMGAKVLAASSVAEAVERLDEAPDVVLSDIGMPEADGFELARRIQAHPNRARLRLIALTGYSGADFFNRLTAAGFDHVLIKPFPLAALRDLIGAGSDDTG
jgi:CheY-like chemotaxis protein